MASIKISGLTEQTTASDTDLLPVASSAGMAKRMTLANFVTWLASKLNSKFAPAGYGLGEKLKYFADISTSEHFKKVCFFDSDDGPYTSSFAGINLMSDTWGFQILFDVYVRPGTIITRRKYLNEWGEWEYINPPMQLGIEYRTTERWQGKSVYAMAVDFGTMPNSTHKILVHGISNIERVISCTGSSSDGCILPYHTNAHDVELSANTTDIAIKNTTNWSNCTAVVVLKYTKK